MRSRFHFHQSDDVEGKGVLHLTLDSDPNPGSLFTILRVHDPYTVPFMMKVNGFLERWPKHQRLGLEVDHPSWFASSSFNEALQKHLQRSNTSLVINNAFGSRYYFHPHVKQEHLFIRYIGDGFIERDKHRLRQWSDRLNEFYSSNMDIFFVVKDSPEACTQTIAYLRELLKLGDDLPESEQLDLF